MSQKTIAQKLLIRDNYKVLIVNCPDGYQTKMGRLPTGAKIFIDSASKPFDLIQIFVYSTKQLVEHLPKMKQLLKQDGLLWTTYPKGKAEINRDSIRIYAQTIGLQAVSLVAIDETWSALRLRTVPAETV